MTSGGREAALAAAETEVAATRVARLHQELPIFALERGPRKILYVAGHLAVADGSEVAQVARWLAGKHDVPEEAARLAAGLKARAHAALQAWRDLSEGPFVPECLTVYLSNECRSACSYCWASASRRRGARRAATVGEEAVDAAARLVATACAERGAPFRLAVHGGGEPTLHWSLLQRIVASTRQIAAGAGVQWSAHLATNGVMSEARARWLAGSFSSVGLSCDGPPDLHDRQRPRGDGRPTSGAVRRTARLLAEAGIEVEVRSTITPASADRQRDIVDYVVSVLGVKKLRFEPLYGVAAPADGGFGSRDAVPFAEGFLAAQAHAATRGCRLEFARGRMGEVHGPFCDALRGVVHVLPDGSANACFFALSGTDPFGAAGRVGGYDRSRGLLDLDLERTADHRRRATRIPARCRTCVALFHCARECPEVCVARATQVELDGPGGFACGVTKLLCQEAIIAAAGMAAASSGATSTSAACSGGAGMEVTGGRPVARGKTGSWGGFPEAMLREVPEGVDRDALREAWRAIEADFSVRHQSPPAPPWAERGYEWDGPRTWELLRGEVARRAAHGPISVYVHVPFCRARCPFCDCYSVSARKGVQERFAGAFRTEVQAWAGLEGLTSRPVTTVHLGGGTPNQLAPELLGGLIGELRGALTVTGRTEWALESTSSLLSADHLRWLASLGFRRLHVGVQTLADGVRRAIGRRESAERVEGRLDAALAAGFVVSVDLIYGLPGQGPTDLAADISRLVEIGVQGFSLYQLQVSERNRRFAERHGLPGCSAVRDWLCFQVGEQLLTRAGYRKNHFAHFARPEDANTYYTHAARGEDLLALGPIADGLFGGLSYRHEELDGYLEKSRSGLPALAGGVGLDAGGEASARARALLLSGRVTREAMLLAGAPGVLERWCAAGLVRADEAGGFLLTANGSWSVGAMVGELSERVAREA